MLQVRVFARGCQSARLELNGVAVGPAVPFAENLTAVFNVPYSPGTLAAVCLNGSVILPGIAAALTTADRPAALNLSADRPAIAHDLADLAFITVSVLDAAGLRVPEAAVPVAFAVSGPGKLIAVGSGES